MNHTPSPEESLAGLVSQEEELQQLRPLQQQVPAQLPAPSRIATTSSTIPITHVSSLRSKAPPTLPWDILSLIVSQLSGNARALHSLLLVNCQFFLAASRVLYRNPYFMSDHLAATSIHVPARLQISGRVEKDFSMFSHKRLALMILRSADMLKEMPAPIRVGTRDEADDDDNENEYGENEQRYDYEEDDWLQDEDDNHSDRENGSEGDSTGNSIRGRSDQISVSLAGGRESDSTTKEVLPSSSMLTSLSNSRDDPPPTTRIRRPTIDYFSLMADLDLKGFMTGYQKLFPHISATVLDIHYRRFVKKLLKCHASTLTTLTIPIDHFEILLDTKQSLSVKRSGRRNVKAKEKANDPVMKAERNDHDKSDSLSLIVHSLSSLKTITITPGFLGVEIGLESTAFIKTLKVLSLHSERFPGKLVTVTHTLGSRQQAAISAAIFQAVQGEETEERKNGTTTSATVSASARPGLEHYSIQGAPLAPELDVVINMDLSRIKEFEFKPHGRAFVGFDRSLSLLSKCRSLEQLTLLTHFGGIFSWMVEEKEVRKQQRKQQSLERNEVGSTSLSTLPLLSPLSKLRNLKLSTPTAVLPEILNDLIQSGANQDLIQLEYTPVVSAVQSTFLLSSKTMRFRQLTLLSLTVSQLRIESTKPFEELPNLKSLSLSSPIVKGCINSGHNTAAAASAATEEESQTGMETWPRWQVPPGLVSLSIGGAMAWFFDMNSLRSPKSVKRLEHLKIVVPLPINQPRLEQFIREYRPLKFLHHFGPFPILKVLEINFLAVKQTFSLMEMLTHAPKLEQITLNSGGQAALTRREQKLSPTLTTITTTGTRFQSSLSASLSGSVSENVLSNREQSLWQQQQYFLQSTGGEGHLSSFSSVMSLSSLNSTSSISSDFLWPEFPCLKTISLSSEWELKTFGPVVLDLARHGSLPNLENFYTTTDCSEVPYYHQHHRSKVEEGLYAERTGHNVDDDADADDDGDRGHFEKREFMQDLLEALTSIKSMKWISLVGSLSMRARRQLGMRLLDKQGMDRMHYGFCVVRILGERREVVFYRRVQGEWE